MKIIKKSPDPCEACPAAANICEAGPDEACEQFWEKLIAMFSD
jgi:hypothetical protein